MSIIEAVVGEERSWSRNLKYVAFLQKFSSGRLFLKIDFVHSSGKEANIIKKLIPFVSQN